MSSPRVSPPGERVSVDHRFICRLIGAATRFVIATGDAELRESIIAVIDDLVVIPPAGLDLFGTDAADVPEAER